MKKWTVMLIPHDRTSSRTLTMTTLHVWVPVGFLIVITFVTAFLFQRERALRDRYDRLESVAAEGQVSGAATISDEQQKAWEKLQAENEALRAENGSLKSESETDRAAYRDGIATVTARLNEVLEVETQIRNFTGLAPRGPITQADLKAVGGGKGGPPDGFGDFALARVDDPMRPPHLIYGMSQPSADLIIEEIDMRSDSLRQLLRGMEAQRDRIDRVPSMWPVTGGSGQMTSSFGYRKDPFTRRIRHHDGVDIAAHSGTKVVATAKGKIVEAGHDGYYGNVVKISHGDGLETWYAHLSKILVRAGETVDRGAVVGHVGSTGRSTGPHLHYEVRSGGKPVNAAKYLSR